MKWNWQSVVGVALLLWVFVLRPKDTPAADAILNSSPKGTT